MAELDLELPIVVIDDDQQALSLLKSLLTRKGHRNVLTFSDGQAAASFLDRHDAAVIILDLQMPEISGHSLLEQLTNQKPHVPVIIVTAENQLETAVDCMRTGATDFITKPISFSRLMTSIDRALDLRHLNDELHSLEEAPSADTLLSSPHFAPIITKNEKMLDLFRYLEIIAHSQQPVLVTGETGVGKELFARAIHGLSGRNGSFVSVNVAGLDDQMFSDTLFGHRKGAYTGALSNRDGLIAKACQGTLFLDEIGDLSESSQIKLLRLLQENEFYPLGCDVPQRSTARLVVATHRNLKAETKFRRDLYYRICSHQIAIPPLKQRQDDLPLLLDHFIAEAARTMKKGKLSYRSELIEFLRMYDFPGNIRELQAMVIDVVAKCTTSKITVASFKELIARERGTAMHLRAPRHTDMGTKAGAIVFESFPTLKEAEAELISRALVLANGNQGNAAQLLGITRQALNNRLRRNA